MTGPFVGHLGARASALLDGQLPPAEAERLWAHVHGCHLCRDLVEREGWVKTRLSHLGADACAPAHLKGALVGAIAAGFPEPVRQPRPLPLPPVPQVPVRRRSAAVAASVGGAAGVAVLGVLALGAAPADAPTGDRRAPVANLPSPGSSATLTPVRRELRP